MYDQAFIANRQPAKVGGWLDDLIKTIGQGVNVASGGISVWQQISQQFGGGGGGSGQARGLQAITQRTNEILAAMESLKSQIGQRPYQEITSAAQQAVAALSNHSVIYQAKKDKDAEVLANAKRRANQILQEIVAIAGSVTGNIQNQTGQIITSGGGAVTGGLDFLGNNPILYVAGGALIAYLLFKK